mgnify:CR=1 FL=1
MLETLGWIGGVLLAVCGAPEAYRSFRRGKTDIGWSFLLMWYIGEIFTFIPVFLALGTGYLLLNYGLNILFITVLIWYKIFPRKTS